MAEYLYPLTLSLVPCDPIDRTGVYYFNYCHPTITHPLKKDLSIKSYHEKIFSSPSFILTPPKFDHNHETLIFFTPSHTHYILLSSICIVKLTRSVLLQSRPLLLPPTLVIIHRMISEKSSILNVLYSLSSIYRKVPFDLDGSL